MYKRAQKNKTAYTWIYTYTLVTRDTSRHGRKWRSQETLAPNADGDGLMMIFIGENSLQPSPPEPGKDLNVSLHLTPLAPRNGLRKTETR